MKTAATAILFTAIIATGCTSMDSTGPETTDTSPDMEPPEQDQEESTDTSGNAPENSDTVDSVSADATVYYTSGGFQPQQVTVDEGDTVRWVNNASGGMWVGSNDHPTHTKYDGTSTREHCPNPGSDTFDQCSSGDSYSFTFNKTGEWGYHNHVAAFDKGTVTVE